MHRGRAVCSKWTNPPFRHICQLYSQQRGDEQSNQARSLTVDSLYGSDPAKSWTSVNLTDSTRDIQYIQYLPGLCTPALTFPFLPYQHARWLDWSVCTHSTHPPPHPELRVCEYQQMWEQEGDQSNEVRSCVVSELIKVNHAGPPLSVMQTRWPRAVISLRLSFW